MTGHRVVLGVEHVPHRGAGGEAGGFVDLMVELASRLLGSRRLSPTARCAACTSRGFRSETGCPAISPARRKSKERGGIVIGKHGHAAAQLPPSRTRTAWIDECGGHILYAAGGTIYERVVTADGEP